jgi:hypothetical protein
MSLDDDDADVLNARQVNRFLLQKPKTWNKNKETRLLFFEKKKHFNRFFFLLLSFLSTQIKRTVQKNQIE